MFPSASLLSKETWTASAGHPRAMWQYTSKVSSSSRLCELAQQESRLSRSFALQRLQRGAWPGQFKTEGSTLFSLILCFPLHTSQETLFINIYSMTEPGLMLTCRIPMRLVLILSESAPLFFWCLWPEFAISHSPFSGIKVKVTDHNLA